MTVCTSVVGAIVLCCFAMGSWGDAVALTGEADHHGSLGGMVLFTAAAAITTTLDSITHLIYINIYLLFKF